MTQSRAYRCIDGNLSEMPLVTKPKNHPEADGAIRDEHGQCFALKSKARTLQTNANHHFDPLSPQTLPSAEVARGPSVRQADVSSHRVQRSACRR